MFDRIQNGLRRLKCRKLPVSFYGELVDQELAIPLANALSFLARFFQQAGESPLRLVAGVVDVPRRLELIQVNLVDPGSDGLGLV